MKGTLVVSVVLVAAVAGERQAGATVIASGYDSTCLIDHNTNLYCWGNNSQGQLGVGDFQSYPTPRQLGGSGWTAVSIGHQFACGLRNGETLCWGANDHGQLGNGTTTFSNVPLPATIPLPLTDRTDLGVATGYAHACAITRYIPNQGRYAYCWGWNHWGQAGWSAYWLDILTPTQLSWGTVPSGEAPNFNPSKIVAGNEHTCAISNQTSRVYCWGHNDYGQLGAGNPYFGSAPDWTAWPHCIAQNPVGDCYSNYTAQDIAAGMRHTCVLQNGYVYCWGRNYHGELGIGDLSGGGAIYYNPVYAVATGAGAPPGPQLLTGVTAISSGMDAEHTCAIKAPNDVYCWGRSDMGQIGDGMTTNRPYAAFVMSSPQQIGAGGKHSCSMWTSSFTITTRAGPVTYYFDNAVCWGRGLDGELGYGDFYNQSWPTDVYGF